MLTASGALGTEQGHLGLYLSPNNNWVVSRLWMIVPNLWMEKPSRPIKKSCPPWHHTAKMGLDPRHWCPTCLPYLLGDWEERLTWLGGPGEEGRQFSGEGALLLGEEGRGGLSERGAAPWGLTMPSSPVPGLPQVKPLHSHSRYLTPLPMCSHVPLVR